MVGSSLMKSSMLGQPLISYGREQSGKTLQRTQKPAVPYSLGQPLISYGREQSGKTLQRTQKPPIMGQVDDYYNGNGNDYDDDDAFFEELFGEMEDVEDASKKEEDGPDFWDSVGSFVTGGLNLFGNVLTSVANKSSTVPKTSNPGAIDPRTLALMMRQNPSLIPMTAQSQYSLATMSRQRPLSTDERIYLQNLTRSRQMLPKSFRSRIDKEGIDYLSRKGASDSTLSRVGNFFFKADSELGKKRRFTLKSILPYAAGGALIIILWRMLK